MSSFVTKAYGATGTPLTGRQLHEMEVKRQSPGADEILIEVLYCGVCHSDIHQVANDWKNTVYPCVPGHEIIGKVTETGAMVHNFKAGDIVGVGCMIDSCRHCEACESGEEQFCQGPVGPTMTYNGYFNPDGSGFNTFGGFSTHIVANKQFVLSIPAALDITKAAPILCAGVTTYSPLRHWNVQPGDTVGVAGIGGLGHMAVMIAKAMGARVIAITSTEDKLQDALALGADEVIVSTNKEQMQAYAVSLNYLLVTIPDAFDVNDYLGLLKWRGSLVTVGLLDKYKSATNNMEVARLSRSVGGSLIGSIEETQLVLQFCADHNILPQTELINIQDINKAFDKIKNEDVRFRYVIDMKSLKEENA